MFTIVVGFMHDLAAGCWAATVLSVYWLERIQQNRQAMSELLRPLQREFFYIGLVCVAIVLIAGVGRTFTYAYIGDIYGREAEPLRRKLLIIKHVLLFLIFGTGIYWQYNMVFN